MSNNKVLVIAEKHGTAVSKSTACAITAALQCGDACDVLLADVNDTLSQELASFIGVNTVWVITHERFAHILAEDLSPVIIELAKNYTHIVAPATTFGKNILPRVAACLDVAQISEVTGIENTDTFIRPIYAGNAYETVQSNDAIKIFTVRTTAFEAAEKDPARAPAAKITPLDYKITPCEKIRFHSEAAPELTRPELTSASIVISGGRGLKSAENFKLIEKLADKLGAAVGASRAAVDAGFVPNDFQVGQTGKIVAPTLYIAVGISGAIQHLAGMKDSKIIVAINQDPDAPIFQVADYGLVGDLFTILPALEGLL